MNCLPAIYPLAAVGACAVAWAACHPQYALATALQRVGWDIFWCLRDIENGSHWGLETSEACLEVWACRVYLCVNKLGAPAAYQCDSAEGA